MRQASTAKLLPFYEAQGPLSTLEIAGAITIAQGDTSTKKQRSVLVRGVGASLRRLRRIGRVKSERNGLQAWWTVVRDDAAEQISGEPDLEWARALIPFGPVTQLDATHP
jgi:hypothetical protein